MKATGIVRRIDDLGRVVIPKEIRRTLRIREADPLEIFTDREGEIILKKYSPQVIAAAGGIKKDTIGHPVTGQLEEVMNDRENVSTGDKKEHVKITNEDADNDHSQVISPILCEGDVIGSVILRSRDTKGHLGETEQMLAKCAAGFMGKQMEQ